MQADYSNVGCGAFVPLKAPMSMQHLPSISYLIKHLRLRLRPNLRLRLRLESTCACASASVAILLFLSDTVARAFAVVRRPG